MPDLEEPAVLRRAQVIVTCEERDDGSTAWHMDRVGGEENTWVLSLLGMLLAEPGDDGVLYRDDGEAIEFHMLPEPDDS
jgi:hypothetical protein